MSKAEDLTGQKFNRLTVLERAENTKSGCTRWLCKCDCGNTKIVMSSHLKSGRTKSCGCYNREMTVLRNFKHGLTNTKLFKIWQNMKNRCYNKNADNYSYYGGRGIKICNEWLYDFVCFYDWANKNGYKDGLTIDRIDGNGNYEPNNCRWANFIQQANNKVNNRILEYNGEKHTMAQWSRILKINNRTLSTGINRDGRTLGEIIKRNEDKHGT